MHTIWIFLLDDLLEPLQERFGAPTKVLPALVKRILAPNRFQPTYDSLVAADSQLCVTYDSIKAITGDSLSKFLAFVSLAHFDKSLLESWDIYARDKITFPTMEDVRKFLRMSLIHKSPSYNPSSAAAATSSLPPSSSSNPFATVITPSIPSHLPLPQRPQLPKKSHTHCVACDQYHGLLRCPTFNAMDVDQRNKLVREKRLCINCFSSKHGCKSCTSKFSCRTCNAKHHTLLHKDRVSASPQSAPATSDSPAAMTVSLSGDSAPADSDQELKPAFLHMVTATLENNGHTARACAILDAGACVSLISEKLASLLHLTRRPQRLSFSGAFSSKPCKYSVVTNLFSHNKSYIHAYPFQP